MFCPIVKQLISSFLLSMLLSQSVFSGVVIPLELDNNTLSNVGYHVNHNSIKHHCTYDDSTLGIEQNALNDSKVNTHQCHHHNINLLFLFNDPRFTVPFDLNQVIFINHSNFNSNILEPPFKPPITL